MTFYHASLAGLIVIIIVQALVIRYLGIDPGFRIKTRAAGELSIWSAFLFRRVAIIFGDVDSLGLANGALTDEAAGVLGHDRMNEVMRWTLGGMRAADKALVYGGDELRLMLPVQRFPHGRRRLTSARAVCERVQARLRTFPFTSAERGRLLAATGKDHISITLAYVEDVRYLDRRAALNRAKITVGAAKPKDQLGLRGHVLVALGE